MSGPELVLGYWNFRGLAEPIRLLLTHLEVPFEDKRYSIGPAPDFDRHDWDEAKETLGLDFPNLPYLLDGALRITESKGILKYICLKEKPEYLGIDLVTKARVEELMSLISTINSKVVTVCYDPQFSSLISDVLMTTKVDLTRIAKVLDHSRFLVGSEPTYVDFLFFELLQLLGQIQPGYLTGVSSAFVPYQAHVRSLAHVVEFEHRTSPRLMFNGPRAGFNVAVP